MKYIFIGILFLGFAGFLSWYLTKDELTAKYNNLESSLRESFEYAYSEGQKDALRDTLRIKYDSVNKVWYWISSPWLDKTKPTYDLNSKNPDSIFVKYGFKKEYEKYKNQK